MPRLDDIMDNSLYSIESRVQLNDGETYPRFGLGVYVTEPGAETYNAVTWALEAGYRVSEDFTTRRELQRAYRPDLSPSPLHSSLPHYTSSLRRSTSTERNGTRTRNPAGKPSATLWSALARRAARFFSPPSSCTTRLTRPGSNTAWTSRRRRLASRPTSTSSTTRTAARSAGSDVGRVLQGQGQGEGQVDWRQQLWRQAPRGLARRQAQIRACRQPD
ncbi:RHTO0S08e03730g1_1 [Rhodotorula toruloides]|uniref:RHTO0S08e03730g1_1 n=1 Tax=Rhodotorula toruloides TaxID=5286 RepID=A0A061B1F8_RHOTO|nr:RHTO0S08e03730g1_1 [Rhodotorula toruloides]